MKYDRDEKTLYADDGTFIKYLDCPLQKKWDELQVLDGTDLKRWCSSCKKDVVNIGSFDDRQVQALVAVNPDACLYASGKFGNVTFVGSEDVERRHHDPPKVLFSCSHSRVDVPVIGTARTIAAINQGALNSYWPLLRSTAPADEIKEKILVHQKADGTIETGGDYRSMANFTDYWHNPYHSPLPFAAYLIPRSLAPGTRVYLSDVIEDLLGDGWNQGDKFRREGAFAIWDGSDLVIEEQRYTEVVG